MRPPENSPMVTRRLLAHLEADKNSNNGSLTRVSRIPSSPSTTADVTSRAAHVELKLSEVHFLIIEIIDISKYLSLNSLSLSARDKGNCHIYIYPVFQFRLASSQLLDTGLPLEHYLTVICFPSNLWVELCQVLLYQQPVFISARKINK